MPTIPTIPTMFPTMFPTIGCAIFPLLLITYDTSRPSRPLNAGARARILLMCFLLGYNIFSPVRLKHGRDGRDGRDAL